MKGLIYVGKKTEINEKYFQEINVLGRKLYEYRLDRNTNKRKPLRFNTRDLDWPFPDLFYYDIGFTVCDFTFQFKNTSSALAAILNPVDNLINTTNIIEEADNNFKEGHFFHQKKTHEEKIVECNTIPTKNFVNESYFLSDKSNLIKKHMLLQLTNNC